MTRIGWKAPGLDWAPSPRAKRESPKDWFVPGKYTDFMPTLRSGVRIPALPIFLLIVCDHAMHSVTHTVVDVLGAVQEPAPLTICDM